MKQNKTPLLVSKRAAAEKLSVCERTITRLIAQGVLPHRKVGKRTLVPYDALVAYATGEQQ